MSPNSPGHLSDEMIHELLLQSGYTVLQANNGADGLEIARQHQGPIYLLLTDVMMPGMTGPKLADALTISRPETKVLYMSGYADFNGSQSKLFGSGAPILEKPFTRSSLNRKVRDVLELDRVTS